MDSHGRISAIFYFQVSFLVLLACLSVLSKPTLAKSKSNPVKKTKLVSKDKPECVSTSRISLRSKSNLSVYNYICYDDIGKKSQTKYCRKPQKDMNCALVDLKAGSEIWKSLLKSTKGTREKKVIRSLRDSKSYKSLLLASSLDLLKLKKPLSVAKNFRLLTGNYSRAVLNRNPIRIKCLEEILAAAQILQREFAEFSFEMNDQIQRCDYLRRGIAELVKNKKQVGKNLRHISSPLHTIYLTDQTKFNDDTLGQMGLYVNVNRKNEIKSRLVDFKIDHKLRLSGLAAPK